MAKRTNTEQPTDPPSTRMSSSPSGASAASVIIAMEPDLRLLKGLITVLRYLSERAPSDTIEPTAIAAISIPAEDAVDRMINLSRGQ